MTGYSSDCPEVLGACDEALTACDKALKAKTAESEATTALLLSQTKELTHLKESQSDTINNRWLWLAIGVAIGGTASYMMVGRK